MADEQKRDAELVSQILSGDENAFATLYRRYKPRLQQSIASKIDDWRDVEELTDDTFLKAKAHLRTLREPEKVLNWLFRIADQLVADWYRKQKGELLDTLDVYEGEGEAAATAVLHEDAQA